MFGIALLLASLGVAASVLFGENGITHWLGLRAERRQFGEAAFILLERNQALREEIRRLRGDDLYLEELARRQLGFVRPNEYVYRFRSPLEPESRDETGAR